MNDAGNCHTLHKDSLTMTEFQCIREKQLLEKEVTQAGPEHLLWAMRLSAVLAEAQLTQEQFNALAGPDLDYMGFRPRLGLPVGAEPEAQQWQRDSARLELLVKCSYPALKVRYPRSMK